MEVGLIKKRFGKEFLLKGASFGMFGSWVRLQGKDKNTGREQADSFVTLLLLPHEKMGENVEWVYP